jgi:hypothetical protein
MQPLHTTLMVFTTLQSPGLTSIACGATRCMVHASMLARGTKGGASARRRLLRLGAAASAARGTNGGASARSLLRGTSADAPLPVHVAAAAVAGLAAGAAMAAPAGAACSSCSSLARTCGAKPLTPTLQPASAAGAGGVAVPAARVVAAGDATCRAARVAAPLAGAAGWLLQAPEAAAGADSAALSRRAAGASAHSGYASAAALSLPALRSAARLIVGAAAGAASGVAAAGAAATSAATAAGARGACSRYAAGYQGHVVAHKCRGWPCASCCALCRQTLCRRWGACSLACNSLCQSSTSLRHTPSASEHDQHGGRTSVEVLTASSVRDAASSSEGRPGCGAGAGTSRHFRPCRNPARHAAMHTIFWTCTADF